MNVFLYIIIGVVGGLLGGMGMGGGTLLIPFLTMFTGTEQHLAQAVNLIAFIPMSAFALFIHIKNGLVDFKYLIWISLPAVAAGVLASYLTKSIGGEDLKRYFGIFLVILGVYQLATIIISFVRERRALKRSLAKGRVEALTEAAEEIDEKKFRE